MSNEKEPSIKANVDLSSYNAPFYILIVAALFISLIIIILLELKTPEQHAWVWRIVLNVAYGAVASLAFLLLVDAVLIRRNLNFTSQAIGNEFERKLEGAGIAVHGIKQVHDGLPHAILRQRLREMDQLVFLQTFVADMVQLEYDLKNFFERGGKATVLLLNYDSELVDVRSKEIRNVNATLFRESIINNIGTFIDIGKGNVEIRLHNSIPSVSLYGDTKTLFVGHYLQDYHAVQGPILEVSSGFYMHRLHQDFQKLWNTSKKLDIERFNALRKQNVKENIQE